MLFNFGDGRLHETYLRLHRYDYVYIWYRTTFHRLFTWYKRRTVNSIFVRRRHFGHVAYTQALDFHISSRFWYFDSLCAFVGMGVTCTCAAYSRQSYQLFATRFVRADTAAQSRRISMFVRARRFASRHAIEVVGHLRNAHQWTTKFRNILGRHRHYDIDTAHFFTATRSRHVANFRTRQDSVGHRIQTHFVGRTGGPRQCTAALGARTTIRCTTVSCLPRQVNRIARLTRVVNGTFRPYKHRYRAIGRHFTGTVNAHIDGVLNIDIRSSFTLYFRFVNSFFRRTVFFTTKRLHWFVQNLLHNGTRLFRRRPTPWQMVVSSQ